MSVARALTLIGFGLMSMIVLATEWAARRPTTKIPTLAEMCGFVMRYRVGRLPVGRIAMFGFWWWLGWHFLAR